MEIGSDKSRNVSEKSKTLIYKWYLRYMKNPQIFQHFLETETNQK